MKRSRLDGQQYDVIVCGAGSAGIAGAYAAALTGARTLLLERLGFCGGTPVAAAIHTLDALYSCRDSSVQVVGGFATSFLKEVAAMGGNATPDNPEEAHSMHPEFMKIAIDRLLSRAGVTVLFHALVIDALREADAITGVEAAMLDGRACFRAQSVIDGTGDATVAFYAGAEYAIDRELQALTYHFRLGNVQPGYTWRELEDACRIAMEQFAPASFRYGGPWVIRLADGEVTINSTRVYGNPVDPDDRSAAERRGREDMLEIWRILRDGVPALRESYILSGATDLHVRESRKIVGDYTLTEEDLVMRRRFPDTIALGAWPIDIHPTDGFVGVHPHKENPPVPYEIPYRCLLPRGLDGLLVAGKPISTTHRAHGSTRVPGTSMGTGHAAGVAAALAARRLCPPRQVPLEELREMLVEHGAILALGEEVSH
jgi:hypothetical protein